MNVALAEDALTVQLKLALPPDAAWTLLTETAGRKRWWPQLILEARLGGAFEETWREGGRTFVTRGEVKRLEAPSETAPGLLELSWADADWPRPTRVALTVEAHAAAQAPTLLTLTQSGWDMFPKPARLNLIRRHAEAWSQHLARLEQVARQDAGPPAPPAAPA